MVLLRFLLTLTVLFSGLTFAVKLHLKPNARYICYVTRVLDGDTIRCRFYSSVVEGVDTVPVRLIGIDTPETSPRKKNVPVQIREIEKSGIIYLHKRERITRGEVAKLGLEAKRFVENILKNIYAVVVETDIQPFDRYGRVLGYVWLPDGRMLNKEIICKGYALPLTIPPNVKYSKIFTECFKRAIEKKLGLWGEIYK